MKRSTRRRALLGGAAASALVLAGLTAPPAHADATELLQNGTFDSGTAPWWSTANAPLRADAGRLCTDVPAGAANPWDVSLGHNDIPLVDGAAYHLTFAASASAPVSVKANVQLNEDPFTAVLSRDVALTPAAQTFTYDFTGSLDSTNGTLTFQLGGSAEAWTFCLDDASLTSDAAPPAGGAEQLQNGDFSNGDGGWYNYGTTSTAVVNGQLCSDVPGGLANPWDAGVGQNGVTLKAGAEYKFSFDAAATPGATVRAAVQLGAEPFTGYFSRDIPLTADVSHQEFTFTATEDTTAAQVAFQVGANAAAYRLCLDNVSLIGGDAKPPYVPDTGSRVRVNQVGYLPAGPKNATVVTEATDPLAWQLKNAAGDVVAGGNATPRGVDAGSGQNVQSIDFSSFRTAGTGYTLVADGQTSYPFDINADVYKQLRSDSLQFFYIQRSGTAIDGSLVGAQYARPAGHLNVAPNQGDKNVPCQPGVCDYRLDAQGGWYDAGDHGKYVVNGGIATYQLLSAFERTKNAAAVALGALGDSTLRVPERGNGTPDVLDEARWELEFLLRMQVPAGKPFAGMAHHKLHDQNWTGLPLQPQDDPQPRELHPVSTAATLNLAATAAQGARLFAPYDAAFASKALTAAKTAYAAAKANPDKIASDADGTGGGAYGDRDVSDEFYWAAAELYLTTGEQSYLTDVQASPHHTGDVFTSAGFSWGGVAALGRLDLATVPSLLPAAEKKRLRDSVVAAADAYLATANGQAYGLPMPGDANHYFWGANSNIINNDVVLATAFDLTGTAKYRDAAIQGMDYIFGRNGLNNSYVTGWGDKFSQNQHTRIYSHQLDASLPHPPPGSIAGGANAGLDDPFAKGLLAGCKPMFCYVDDIQSYATNEVAINWNSALAWMASFLADQGAAAAPALSCKVAYVTHGDWKTGFTSQVTITNTGRSAIDGWALRWSFLGGQKIDHAWLATVTQSGAAVTAKNVSSNKRIQPGSAVTFGFTATSTGGPNPNPTVFTLNGSRCS